MSVTANLGAVTAYGIARKNGYTGTEAEWLASLKGDTGATGATGAAGHSPTVTATKSGKVTTISVDGTAIATVNDGADGEKGEKGDTGAQGIQGIQGEKGDTGATGVVSATAPLAYDATNKKLSISMGDYIEEQGTSGIWTYRKWSSGIAECWGSKTATYNIAATKWAGYWYTASISYDYPTDLFTAAPMIIGAARCSDALLHFFPASSQSKTACTFSIGTHQDAGDNTTIASALASQSCIVNIIAKGKWK